MGSNMWSSPAAAGSCIRSRGTLTWRLRCRKRYGLFFYVVGGETRKKANFSAKFYFMRFINNTKQTLGGVMVCFLMAACGNNTSNPTAAAPAGGDSSAIKEETISFPADSANLHAFVVYDDSIKGKRPAVIVLPEWWGLNDYPKMRARMLAKLGYVAMALDVYGDGKVAETPDSASAYAMPFYMHPEKAKARIDAAIAKLRTYDNVDTAEIGAIGYCFGGGLLLNTARLGDDLKGVVSFHGSLIGTPARKDLLRTKLLVLHGNADQFVTPKT